MMDLKRKGVFLTGAATGIGRAVLQALLERGARVLFCDVNEKDGQATREAMCETYAQSDVIFVLCDVSNGEQLKEAFQRAVREFGAVEVCINNAGIANESIPEKMIAINQTAVIRGSLLALEHMRRDLGGRGGVIINTSSVNGVRLGISAAPVYTATKHAIIAFTTSWANNPDQKAHGVRWGVICPGWVCTPLTMYPNKDEEGRRLKPPKLSGDEILTVPIMMRPADLAPGFLTLLDDDDSNGYVIKVYMQEGDTAVRHEILVMDKSVSPPVALVVKKSFTLPPVLEPGTAHSS